MNNINKIKGTASSAEDVARKVWLAGLGAYGKGFEEIKGRMESLSTESNKLFDELVAKGKKLESEGKDIVEEVADEVVAKTEIQSRIDTVRSKLGFNTTDNEQKIDELSAKIDALTLAVATLVAKPAPKPAVVKAKAKPAAKTTSAKTTAAKTAPKAAEKKA